MGQFDGTVQVELKSKAKRRAKTILGFGRIRQTASLADYRIRLIQILAVRAGPHATGICTLPAQKKSRTKGQDGDPQNGRAKCEQLGVIRIDCRRYAECIGKVPCCRRRQEISHNRQGSPQPGISTASASEGNDGGGGGDKQNDCEDGAPLRLDDDGFLVFAVDAAEGVGDFANGGVGLDGGENRWEQIFGGAGAAFEFD